MTAGDESAIERLPRITLGTAMSAVNVISFTPVILSKHRKLWLRTVTNWRNLVAFGYFEPVYR